MCPDFSLHECICYLVSISLEHVRVAENFTKAPFSHVSHLCQIPSEI